ncbi:MarR family transcriptional regulator [Amycolatopsis sp. SID8362]|uniref:MarR family winged helix-turn-helix transcriptional regulator n=1 Tax=Amycolatopsis sp. SID8362 TaxID=2690346 RepID=UPI001368D6B6|nr:MarR family transcriptional regulator [Amycolatopsis sp. SID8362]NBH12321.1 MarR family transcriptional regulator [Amycolatopsis sp. SID8362]NED49013.1 MarR family transcriptional regulator [Amycolatopsis sp. SID8362]
MGGPLNTQEKRAWNAFRSSFTLLHQRMDQQLKRDAGLSHLQYEILARLGAAPGRELRMAELACAVSNSKSGLTYQIGQLEQTGLVRRRACESDVRAVYAVLTDEGADLLARATPGHVALVRELLLDVLTPDQLGALADGLGEANRRMLAAGDCPGR